MAAANSTAPVLTTKQIALFWAKVDRRGSDECWPWIASFNGKGYGHVVFTVATNVTVNFSSHVIARWLATGEWPARLCTLHTCDNRPCCNPAHLWLGTYTDNNQDTVRKGRRVSNVPKGEDAPLAKLTEADVLEIRRLHAIGLHSFAGLGKLFGVTKHCTYYIVKRRTWKHVP